MAEFLVGAVFEVSATQAIESLNAIGSAFERIAGLATSLQERLATVGEAAFTGLLEGVERANTAMAGMVDRTNVIAESWDRAAVAAARYAEVAQTAVRGEEVLPGPRSQRRSQWELGPNILSGMAPFVAPFLDYEAEKSAMTEQLALKQALMGINITEDQPGYTDAYKRMEELVYESTKGTKFSNVEAAKALREALPVLAMEGPEALTAAEKTFPIALRLGELSAHRGKGTVGSEAVAAEEFAHLEQRYDPEQLTNSLNQINAIAMKTDTSVRRQLDIMKYGLPAAMLAGIDPDVAAAEIGAAELRMGATTTAGTGYSQFLLEGMTFKGKVGAGQTKAQQQKAREVEREFQRALALEDPGALRQHMTDVKTDAHDQALIDLGVFTKQGDLLAKTAAGGYDEEKVKGLIAEYAASHTREQVIATVGKAYGTRGMRFAEAFTNPDMIERERTQIQTFRNAPSVEKELGGLSGTALQQFEQMLANVANTGNILATQTLEPLTTAFKYLNTQIIGFNDWLKSNPIAAEFGGWGLLAAGITTGLGLFGLGIKAVTTGLSVFTDALGLAATRTTEAGAATEALGLGFRGLVSRLAPLLLLKGDTAQTGAPNAPSYDEYLLKEHQKFMSSFHDPEHHLGLSPAIPKPPELYGPPAPPPPSTLSITINNAWNGITDTATILSNMASNLTSAVMSGLENSASQPMGSLQSPYMYGGS